MWAPLPALMGVDTHAASPSRQCPCLPAPHMLLLQHKLTSWFLSASPQHFCVIPVVFLKVTTCDWQREYSWKPYYYFVHFPSSMLKNVLSGWKNAYGKEHALNEVSGNWSQSDSHFVILEKYVLTKPKSFCPLLSSKTRKGVKLARTDYK